jgi:hypothetical protein
MSHLMRKNYLVLKDMADIMDGVLDIHSQHSDHDQVDTLELCSNWLWDQ